MAEKRKITERDTRGVRFPRQPVTGGRMTLGTPNVTVKGVRRKKRSNRAPGEAGLPSRRQRYLSGGGAALGGRGAASADRGRSSAT